MLHELRIREQDLHPNSKVLLREQALLLDQARDAIMVLGPEGTIRYWSRGAERMFGFSSEQALGQSFASLVGCDAALSLPLPTKGSDWVGELECVAAGGTHVTVEQHRSVMRDAAGEPQCVLTTSTDITERRRAEKEIVLLNNMLEQRLRRRAAELDERRDELRNFSNALAHDLRGPLSSIGGFSSQLETRLAGALDDTCQHYLRRVRAGVRQMVDLTDALLALAALSETDLLLQSVDLSAIASATLARFGEEEPGRPGLALCVSATQPAQGDEQLLTTVLENLLANAWKFTAATATAEISFGGALQPDGSYRYTVNDNGAGFDPAYAASLFRPFQRLHTAEEFEGCGIGLAIVRKIVLRHGGRVWAESRLGHGTDFCFTLNDAAPPPRPVPAG